MKNVALADDKVEVDDGLGTLALEGSRLAARVSDEGGTDERGRCRDGDLILRSVEDELSRGIETEDHDGSEGQGVRSETLTHGEHEVTSSVARGRRVSDGSVAANRSIVMGDGAIVGMRSITVMSTIAMDRTVARKRDVGEGAVLSKDASTVVGERAVGAVEGRSVEGAGDIAREGAVAAEDAGTVQGDGRISAGSSVARERSIEGRSAVARGSVARERAVLSQEGEEGAGLGGGVAAVDQKRRDGRIRLSANVSTTGSVRLNLVGEHDRGEISSVSDDGRGIELRLTIELVASNDCDRRLLWRLSLWLVRREAERRVG